MFGNHTARGVAAMLAAGLLILLPACSSNGDANDDPGQLSILDYYNNEPDKSLIQEGLDRCAAQLDVTLERETVPGADLISKVLQRASSDTLPDVLMLDNPDVQQIAASGALSPLESYGIDTAGYAEGIVSATTYEGQNYGLVPVVNTIALFYNTDILSEAGVEPPKTWAELRETARDLTTPDRYGMAFNANATYEGTWQFLPAMWTNGGDETDLTSPQVAEALRLWVDLVNDGSASKSVINWTQGDVKDQFVAGKAAMMLNGPWNIPSMNETPDVKWDVVLFPVREPSQTPVAPLGGEAWTVPATGKEATQQKAAEFVSCLSSKENQLGWAKARYTVPTRTELIDEYVADMPTMKSFAEQVITARARTGKLGPEWPDAAKVIYQAMQLALTGEVAPEDAFRTVIDG